MSTRKNAALLLAAAAVVLVAIPAPAFAQFPFFDHGSGLRFQVEPAETEIFIDGYYVGRVDDYDGFFQRLRFPPGEHEIELYLGGYRSVQQKVLVQPGATFRVRHAMAALQPGDTPRSLLLRLRPDADLGSFRVAVDGEFAEWDTPLDGAGELAIIPPVSGG